MLVSQTIENQSISKSSITTLGLIPKGYTLIPKEYLITEFIGELFIIARTWKQPKYPSTEEIIKKMGYIYTMEYYSAVKNIDTLKFSGKWMELEKKIILNEVTQIQKDKYGMYSLISRY